MPQKDQGDQSKNRKKQKKVESDKWLINNYKNVRLAVFGQTAFYTLAMIAIMGGIGYGLDQLFDTDPKLLIAGLFLGYPVTLMILHRKFKKYSQDKLKERKNGKH